MKIRLVGKPKDAPYLTPGKVYEVIELQGLHLAIFKDDDGDEISALLPSAPHPCIHARPAHWEMVE